MEQEDRTSRKKLDGNSPNERISTPFTNRPFNGVTRCILAILVMGGVTVGTLCLFSNLIRMRIVWMVDVLTVGRAKADARWRRDGYPNPDLLPDNKFDSDMD